MKSEELFQRLLEENEQARLDFENKSPQDSGEELSERRALKRVAGISTELEDISEAEYRSLRLERVVLVGVWTEGTGEHAENSLKELAALAEMLARNAYPPSHGLCRPASLQPKLSSLCSFAVGLLLP